jgi:hypothetical protein
MPGTISTAKYKATALIAQRMINFVIRTPLDFYVIAMSVRCVVRKYRKVRSQ